MLLLREDNSGTPVSWKGECKKKKLYLGRKKGRKQREKEGGGIKNTTDSTKSHREAFLLIWINILYISICGYIYKWLNWSQGLSSKKPYAPPFTLLIRQIQETSRTKQATAIALGCCPELDEKILFLKISYKFSKS